MPNKICPLLLMKLKQISDKIQRYDNGSKRIFGARQYLFQDEDEF